MNGIKLCNLPKFEINDSTVYCDEIGIIVIGLWGFKTVS